MLRSRPIATESCKGCRPSGDRRARSPAKGATETAWWKQWSTEGKLLGTYEITNGTGTEYRWHDNGKLQSEDSLRAGRRTGTSRGWLPSGELLLETTYYDDREVMRSYEKGVPVSDTVLIDDEIQSETHYDTDGSVTRIDRYENGKLVSSEPAPHE